MQALAASCEELRARTGNPPIEAKLYQEGRSDKYANFDTVRNI